MPDHLMAPVMREHREWREKEMGYELSGGGKGVTYFRWRNIMKGCGLPGNTRAYKVLGPESRWNDEYPTLGQIADACPATGRTLARYAAERLHNDLMYTKMEGEDEPGREN